MNAEITKEGFLRIERPGNPSGPDQRLTLCPFVLVAGPFPWRCGDWCPHFGEPRAVNAGCGPHQPPEGMRVLRICHGKELTFMNLIDHRDDPEPRKAVDVRIGEKALRGESPIGNLGMREICPRGPEDV